MKSFDELRAHLVQSDGVVRSAALWRGGYGRRLLTDAVATGVVTRPRRGWVALPDADPLLVAAARCGVVLTCVTRAERLGLWTIKDSHKHVAAPPHAGALRFDEKQPAPVVHWRTPLIARAPGQLEDSVENVLVAVASCQPFEKALTIWESAVRQELIDLSVMTGYPLDAASRGLLDEVIPFADSGLETIVFVRLKWLPVRIVPQVVIAGHRVDFLIGDRLVLQIDGGHHVGAQRAKDNAHDAKLRLMGYTVIRVGYGQIMDDWPAVQDLVLRAIAQRLHLAS